MDKSFKFAKKKADMKSKSDSVKGGKKAKKGKKKY